jgi:membrane fusion protein (multidrug efflux system)
MLQSHFGFGFPPCAFSATRRCRLAILGLPFTSPVYYDFLIPFCEAVGMRLFELLNLRGPGIPRRGALFVAAALLLGAAGCRPAAPPPSAAPPPEVQVMTVTLQDVPINQDWMGSLDGYVNAQIRAQVSGYLLSQDYKEGSFVRKGDVLFQIDPRPFDAVLKQADGQLGMALAQLGRTELDVKRFTPLAMSNAISQEELDDAVQSNKAAAASVAVCQAAVQQARLNLEFASVTSPIDGVAGTAHAQIGDLVGPATGNLTEVSTLDPIKAYITVTEQYYLDHLAAFAARDPSDDGGMELDLFLANGALYPQKGKFYFLDRQVEPNTGAIQVAVLFPNPGNVLRPGQYARVRARTETRKGVALVPQRAITELQGSFHVDVVTKTNDSNVVSFRQVTIGAQMSNMWIIESGLQSGESIIVEGLQKAAEGKPVNPQPMTISPGPAKT